MPQSLLIDVNTQYLISTRAAKNYLDSGQFEMCTGELLNMISYLPPDYRIEFNTEKFLELTKESLVYVCPKCPDKKNEYEIDSVRKENIRISYDEEIITNKKFKTFWFCDREHENELEQTDIIKNVRPKPEFIRTVPMPPRPQDSIMDREMYRRKYKFWYNLVRRELGAEMQRFREDYHDNNKDNFELYGIDGGEENDSDSTS